MTKELNVLYFSNYISLFKILSSYKNNFNEILDLINKNNLKDIDKNFDKLSFKLHDKKLIKNFNNISNIIFNKAINKDIIYKLSGKELLSIFIFYGFPEYSLELDRDKADLKTIQGKIYICSIKIVSIWKEIINNLNILKNIRKIIEYVKLFSFYFVIHMNNDKMHKINELFQKWYEEEITKDEVKNRKEILEYEKKNLLSIIDDQQKNTIKLLKKFYKNFDNKILENYKVQCNLIKDTFDKAFWNIIKDDLQNNSPESFIKILQELKKNILHLVPECNNKNKLKKELDEYFDCEFIYKQLSGNSYTFKQFFNLCTYILGILEKLQAPKRTKLMKQEWKKISDNNTESLDNYKNYLKFLFNEVDFIREDINNLNILNKLNINIFNL